MSKKHDKKAKKGNTIVVTETVNTITEGENTPQAVATEAVTTEAVKPSKKGRPKVERPVPSAQEITEGLKAQALKNFQACSAPAEPYNEKEKGALDARASRILLNFLSDNGKELVTFEQIGKVFKQYKDVSFVAYIAETPLLQGIDRVAGKQQAYALKTRKGSEVIINTWAQDLCPDGRKGYMKAGNFGPKQGGTIVPIPEQVRKFPEYFAQFPDEQLLWALEHLSRKNDLK